MMGIFTGKEKDTKEMEKRQAVAFQNVFSGDQGEAVLGINLEDLFFFDIADTAEKQALRNYATILLRRCGKTNTLAITIAILSTKRSE